MPALKFLQQTTEEKRTEASEAHSRASFSRNRLPARYRSGGVYNLTEEDEEEGGGRMTMRRGILTRRNRHSLFFFSHTCYFILLGPQSLCFVFVSIGRFVVEISLINEWVV